MQLVNGATRLLPATTVAKLTINRSWRQTLQNDVAIMLSVIVCITDRLLSSHHDQVGDVQLLTD